MVKQDVGVYLLCVPL